MTCTEKLFWTFALIVLLLAAFFGNLRTAGMLIALGAVAWYGVITPFLEEAHGLNLKSKGRVN
ncbi:MAG TPA: hypothetical protein VKW78_05380 [Terriglobales bacterium]|jgi:hypothetical protein|nr:hypothetical protein [Terriglobales bacterium]